MTRKSWLWIVLILGLGALSLYLNRDFFAKDSIQIHHRSRPMRAGLFRRKKSDPLANQATDPVVFAFERKTRLKELKVIPSSDLQTNKYAHAIWHLISESNSAPVKEFFYGYPIQGMHPAIKGATPDPLEPGVSYRLLIDTGDQKAEHEFVPVPKSN